MSDAPGPAATPPPPTDNRAEMLASALGVPLEDGDLEWLNGALTAQLMLSASLNSLMSDELDPMVCFDPRWHD